MSCGVADDTNIVDLVSKQEQETDSKIAYIFVDEVQFFSIAQIEQLTHLADVQDIDIYAYGLLTSYKGELFTASKRLIELLAIRSCKSATVCDAGAAHGPHTQRSLLRWAQCKHWK